MKLPLKHDWKPPEYVRANWVEERENWSEDQPQQAYYRRRIERAMREYETEMIWWAMMEAEGRILWRL